MNWFDIFVAILLLRTSYIGFKNGLSTEIYKAAGFVFSGLAAFYFYKKLGGIIAQYTIIPLLEDSQLKAIVFLMILFAGMLIFKFVFMFIHKVTQLSFAKNFNTAVGMISGFARGALIISVVFTVLNWSAVDYIKESIQTKSFSGPYLVKINNYIKSVLTKIGGEN